MGETISRKKSFGFLNPFRSKKSWSPDSRTTSVSEYSIDELKLEQAPSRPGNKLRKKSLTNLRATPSSKSLRKKALVQSKHPPLPATRVEDPYDRDAQTGERKDHTEMLHSLAVRGSLESLVEKTKILFAGIPPETGEQFLSRFPPGAWERIVDHLDLADAASLAFSCKAFRDIVGTEAWSSLNAEENHDYKTDFLGRLDPDLPDHLLCFPCAIYHLRTQMGHEILRPTNIANPIFNCPNAFNLEKKVSRTRLVVGRTLPFPFLQLILRGQKYSLAHGIPIESMNRRYRDSNSEWSHQFRFAVVHGHLLVRVISSAFAEPALPPAGLRKLLYSPNERFTPYFSVCAHWQDGELMPSVKCALSHIPKPLDPLDASGVAGVAAHVKYRLHRPSPLITLCSQCRPMRRCPKCPSEYLIELRMQEDRRDPSKLFKHAIVLTRWFDLGDGSSPRSREWAACNGDAEYDSFAALGRRAISGTFESQFTVDQIPGQNIISMNPEGEDRGEAGHNWY
ncbi:hypothetical protein A1O1_03418 [Capronia coronata CBS 617.96]|uniref:F-box domain-containing protein n=1 Tax=Capronia coronata CBS 617.96 TaxID=1182541 RepID=W9Z726_9EURO|nr:uncharacterized protein A1O1_03418 [Capronia coronata CBS 617.96]EXJ90319.1 hypothetical protein A1O1_03418 [Capronia coronata CBS 617.96]